MKTYRLFLDDIREPIDAWQYTQYRPFVDEYWIIVRNYQQFVSYITRSYKKGAFPDFVAFDHDLADENYSQDIYKGIINNNKKYKNFQEKTGMDCAKWLIEFCMDNNLKLPDYIVHSMNPVGKLNIESILKNYKKHEEI